MYGVPSSERAARLTETMQTLQAAFTGEPFEYRDRTVRVTPAPDRAGGPGLMLGGSSEVAARRAARLGVGFIPVSAEVWEFYRDEVQQLGRPDPGESIVGENYTLALFDDVERGWEQLGPYFLHENNAYGAWQEQSSARIAVPRRRRRRRAPGPWHVPDRDARRVHRRDEGGAVPVPDLPPDVRRNPARTRLAQPEAVRARRAPRVRRGMTAAPGQMYMPPLTPMTWPVM